MHRQASQINLATLLSGGKKGDDVLNMHPTIRKYLAYLLQPFSVCIRNRAYKFGSISISLIHIKILRR